MCSVSSLTEAAFVVRVNDICVWGLRNIIPEQCVCETRHKHILNISKDTCHVTRVHWEGVGRQHAGHGYLGKYMRVVMVTDKVFTGHTLEQWRPAHLVMFVVRYYEVR